MWLGGGPEQNADEEPLPHAESFLLSPALYPHTPSPRLQGSPDGGRNLEVVGEAQRGKERTLKSHSKLEIEILPNLGENWPTSEGWGSKV